MGQSIQAFAPVPEYFPGKQSEQVATLDAVEYFPLTQAAQDDAPGLGPVFVIAPAWQSEHFSIFDALENFPVGHSVHVVPPLLLPVFVIDPGAQMRQSSCPVLWF